MYWWAHKSPGKISPFLPFFVGACCVGASPRPKDAPHAMHATPIDPLYSLWKRPRKGLTVSKDGSSDSPHAGYPWLIRRLGCHVDFTSFYPTAISSYAGLIVWTMWIPHSFCSLIYHGNMGVYIYIYKRAIKRLDRMMVPELASKYLWLWLPW